MFSFALLCNASLAASAIQNPPVPFQNPSDPMNEERATLANALRGSAAGLQHPAGPPAILIDVFQVYSLPLVISDASLERTRTGASLKLSVSNSSNEQILGIRYWLLVVDADNKVRRAVDQSESLTLNAYAAKTVSFFAPSRLKIGSDDRVFMVVAQVIGRESIWEVRQAREALQDYVKGDGYTMPSVLRVLNQVDSPIGFSPIFLRPKQ